MPIDITVPGNKSIGDPGHVSDHDTIVTALTTLGDDAVNIAGDTLSGPLITQATPSADASSLPVGYGNSQALTGIQVASSHPSDDVNGGTDGTGRLNLYSYQRANTYSFGETIRNFLMRWDAKAMTAWYGPVDLYDESGNAVPNDGWKPWTWIGSHYEANDDSSIHGHWEVEIPDTTGALQGRLIIPFIDDNPASGVYGQIGLTTTNIQLSQSYLTLIAGSTGGAIRIAGPAGDVNRVLEFANSKYVTTSSARWQVYADNTAESGGNAGSNFKIASFSDSAAPIGVPLQVTRSTGLVTLAYSAEVAANLGVGTAPSSTLRVSVLNSAAGQLAQFTRTSTSDTSPVAVFLAGDTSTAQAIGVSVVGDTTNRFGIDPTGKISWGSGSASRDTNLYRSTTATLKTDNSLTVGATLQHAGSSLGFYNTSAVSKPTVTGSKGSNAALTSLMTALAALGLLTDSTS